MSKNVKIFAIIGTLAIVGAGVFWMVGSKPPAEQSTQRGYHP
jgi:hypothetical protein